MTPDPSKASQLSRVSSTSTTRSNSPAASAGSATTVRIDQHHRVADHESVAVSQLGSAEAVQQLLAALLPALQANLKRIEQAPSVPVVASSPANKVPRVRASKLECKSVREV